VPGSDEEPARPAARIVQLGVDRRYRAEQQQCLVDEVRAQVEQDPPARPADRDLFPGGARARARWLAARRAGTAPSASPAASTRIPPARNPAATGITLAVSGGTAEVTTAGPAPLARLEWPRIAGGPQWPRRVLVNGAAWVTDPGDPDRLAATPP